MPTTRCDPDLYRNFSFSRLFVSVCNIVHKVSECNTKEADDRQKTPVSDDLENHVSSEGFVDCSPISFSTVKEIVDSLKPRKSDGQDGIYYYK